MYFTRDTSYRVIDSKRCPHSGSCVGAKCAAINSSTLVPELQEGNSYPGSTFCVESCGGPGCDCFYWSSGCLFYRVYLVPNTSKIYEIFRCDRWREEAKVKFTHTDVIQGKTEFLVASMKPNVPISWKAFTFTLSSLTVPPIPLLNVPFISDGSNLAIWKSTLVPALRCNSVKDAESLQCDVIEDCYCSPAETKANCQCKEVDIQEPFRNLQHRLPITTPALSFRISREGLVQARVPAMTTSEIILTFQDDLKTDIVVDDAICTVSNAILVGCYKCAKGAAANIKCTSSKTTQAEITCEGSSFSVPCDETGAESTLRFSFERAQIHITCSVSCGSVSMKFELGGILKFTNTAHALFSTWISGQSNNPSDFQWPDISHIVNVFLQWMSAAEIDGDTRYLRKFMHPHSLSSLHFENELRTIYNALYKQISISASLTSQWEAIKSEKSFLLAAPGENILLISRCLRTAEITRERILRLGSRYVFTDLLYARNAGKGNVSLFNWQDWREKSEYGSQIETILMMIDVRKQLLDDQIKDMEKVLCTQEKALREAQKTLNLTQVAEMIRRENEQLLEQFKEEPRLRVSLLENQLEAKEAEIRRLRNTIANLERSSAAVKEGKEDVLLVQAPKETRKLEGSKVQISSDKEKGDQNEEVPQLVDDDPMGDFDDSMKNESAEIDEDDEYY
ncbi:hypothetical protein OESDEN_21142, partial [Oesophagostomum dentatum]